MLRAIALATLLCACESNDVSRDVGARCTDDQDCNVRCLDDQPGGFCTVLCDSDDDCPGGTHCITEDGGVCVFSCGSDGECVFLNGGYTCQAVDSEGAGAKVMVCLGSD